MAILKINFKNFYSGPGENKSNDRYGSEFIKRLKNIFFSYIL